MTKQLRSKNMPSPVLSTELLLQELNTQCKKKGFTFEMLFRAADTKNQKQIPLEDFRNFLNKLKLGFSQRNLDRFLFLVDEDCNGIVTLEEYCTTLFAFNLSSEAETISYSKIALNEAVEYFVKYIKQNNINIKQAISNERLTKTELLKFLNDKIEFVSEKQKYLVANYFDRKKLGFILKNQIQQDINKHSKERQNSPQIKNNQSEFFVRSEEPEQLQSAPKPVSAQYKNIKQNMSKFAARSPFEQSLQRKPNIVKQFVTKFEKNCFSLQNLFDFIAEQFKQKNINVNANNQIQPEELQQMLNQQFSNLFTDTQYEQLFDYIIKSTKKTQNIDKQKQMGSDRTIQTEKLVMVDMVQFRTQLLQYSQKKIYTTQYIKYLLVNKLQQMDQNMQIYLKAFKLKMNQKIDFTQFYQLAQKAFFANLQESTSIFDIIDTKKIGKININELIDYFDKEIYGKEYVVNRKQDEKKQRRNSARSQKSLMRSGSNISLSRSQASIKSMEKSNPKKSQKNLNKKVEQKQKPKFEKKQINNDKNIVQQVNIIEKIFDVIKDNFIQKAMSLQHKLGNNIQTQTQMEALNQIINMSSQQDVDLIQLSSLIADNVQNEDDLIILYVKAIANHLDKKEPQESTTNFFKQLNLLNQQNNDDVFICKQFQTIFNFNTKQCEQLINKYTDDDQGSVDFATLIKDIDNFRKSYQQSNSSFKADKEQSYQSSIKSINQQSEEKQQEQQKEDDIEEELINEKHKEPQQQQQQVEDVQKEEEQTGEVIVEEIQALQTQVIRKEVNYQEPQNVIDKRSKINNWFQKIQINFSDLECPDKNPQNIYEQKEPWDLIQALLSLKKQQPLNFQKIEKMLKNQKEQFLHIIYLKNQLRSIFEDEDKINLIVAVFKMCDETENGTIDLKRWDVIQQKIQKQYETTLEQPIHDKSDQQINDDAAFYASIKMNSDNGGNINIDFISQLPNNLNQISILVLRQQLRQQNQKDTVQINKLLQYLKYLDSDQNGFFAMNDIKFLIYIMNYNDIKGASNIELNSEFLMRMGIHEDTILQFGNCVLETSQDVVQSVQTMANIDYKESLLINAFNFFRNLFEFNKVYQEQIAILKVLDGVYIKQKNFDCNYNQILKLFKIEVPENDFVQIVKKSSQQKILIEELLKLRRFFSHQFKTGHKIIKKELNYQSIEKNFDIKNMEQYQFDQFVIFVLYYNVRSLQLQQQGDAQNQISVLEMSKIQISHKKTEKESLKKKLQIIGQKIVKSQITNEFIKQKLFENYSDEKKEYTFKDLCLAFKNLPVQLKIDEILAIFDAFKDMKNKKYINIENVFNFFKEKIKVTDQKAQVKNVQKQVKNKNSDSLLDQFKIDSKYFHNNKGTILTNLKTTILQCIKFIEEMKKRGENKFVDPDFGPSFEDPNGAKAFYYDEVSLELPNVESTEWLRPQQISKQKTPKFMEDGASIGDVQQGGLGDCWLISAMSLIATNSKYFFGNIYFEEVNGQLQKEQLEQLIAGIYPRIFHQFSKYGMYVLKFYKDGQWMYVIIDDRLPCYEGNPDNPQLVFAHCYDKNEFWVPLLEKAYAKLHGNFQSLISGQTDDGLVDFTALVSEKVRFKTRDNQLDIKQIRSQDDFWAKMEDHLKEGSFIGCSISGVGKEPRVYVDGEFTGLIAGHAYAIIDLIDIGSEKLMVIRNPWGADEPTEWNGPWSDNSKEIVENIELINKVVEEKKWGPKIKMTIASAEGLFLMSYSDFLRLWSMVSICVDFPDNFRSYLFRSEWDQSNSGGTPLRTDQQAFLDFATNPQFIMDIKTDQNVYIYVSLSQEDGRLKSQGREMFPFPSYHYPICLGVYKLKEGETELKKFDMSRNVLKPVIKINRDIQASVVLGKGRYSIIPSTQNKECHGKFFLQIFFSCDEQDIQIEDGRQKCQKELIMCDGSNVEKYDSDILDVITALKKSQY